MCVNICVCVYLQGSVDSKASIFTGEEELFAFDRAVSRLVEMQSTAYWEEKSLARGSAIVLEELR